MVDDLFAIMRGVNVLLGREPLFEGQRRRPSQPLWPFRIDAQHPCSMMNIVGAG